MDSLLELVRVPNSVVDKDPKYPKACFKPSFLNYFIIFHMFFFFCESWIVIRVWIVLTARTPKRWCASGARPLPSSAFAKPRAMVCRTAGEVTGHVERGLVAPDAPFHLSWSCYKSLEILQFPFLGFVVGIINLSISLRPICISLGLFGLALSSACEDQVIEDAYRIARKFFELPFEEKCRCDTGKEYGVLWLLLDRNSCTDRRIHTSFVSTSWKWWAFAISHPVASHMWKYLPFQWQLRVGYRGLGEPWGRTPCEASSGFTARGKERVNATATELPDSKAAKRLSWKLLICHTTFRGICFKWWHHDIQLETVALVTEVFWYSYG